jgi:ABC-type glycerol-3-phosphate transport system permease component
MSMGWTRRRAIARTVLYFVLVLIALLWLAPVLWALSTSLKLEETLFRVPIEWIPRPTTLGNYIFLLTETDFPIARWYLNSVLTATMTTVTVLTTNSLAAYAFARRTFPGRDALFAVVIATMLVPGHILLIPLYLMMARLGLINTYPALMIPVATSAFGVFLLRQFFLSFPQDLEDAAIIDGLGSLGVLTRVIIPNAVPGLSALAIFVFLGNWNAFIWPLVITDSLTMLTLPIGLAVFQNEYQTQYQMVMSVAMMSALPVLIVFFIFQTRFIQGITLSGLKG